MKGLLIKDFKLLKGQKNFFMTITAISIIMIIVSPGTSFPIGFLGFVGALFSLSSISYDEFDNGNAFLFSLPITRKDYVLEKYIFGLISGIMFLLLGTVISLVVIGITKTGSFNEIFLTAGSLFQTVRSTASLTALSISESDILEPAVIVMCCSLPVPRSLADTFTIPLASISNVTSICGTPRRAGGIPSRRN